MAEWTKEQDQWLRSNYPNFGVQKSAEKTGRTPRAIAGRAHRLGLKMDRQGEHWKDFQTRAARTKIGRKRPEQAAVMKRLFIDGKMPAWTQQRRNAIGERTKALFKLKGHPRGMKGKRHSAACVAGMIKRVRAQWADPKHKFNSRTYRQGLSDNAANYQASRTNRENDYSRCKRGKRPDLGEIFFRSSWEANYARYLNWQIQTGEIYSWTYEGERFVFAREDREIRSYMPDFKVRDAASSTPRYVEVKGWMDDKSKRRLEMMAKHYPNVSLKLVGAKEYTMLNKQFATVLPGWEIHG